MDGIGIWKHHCILRPAHIVQKQQNFFSEAVLTFPPRMFMGIRLYRMLCLDRAAEVS